jgi:hypothetical protein
MSRLFFHPSFCKCWSEVKTYEFFIIYFWTFSDFLSLRSQKPTILPYKYSKMHTFETSVLIRPFRLIFTLAMKGYKNAPNVCPSLCPHTTTREPLIWFSWNMILITSSNLSTHCALGYKRITLAFLCVSQFYTHIFFLSQRRNSPRGPGPSHDRGFVITLRHTTLGRTPLYEWSARCRDLYLTTHNTRKRQNHGPGGIRTHNPRKLTAAETKY